MTTLTSSIVLDRATDLINTRGLQKDDWIAPPETDDYDENACPLCILAAINAAAGQYYDEPLTDVTLDAAAAVAAHLGLDHLLKDADNAHDKLIEVLGHGWNDHPCRTKADVVHALRMAARSEREAGR